MSCLSHTWQTTFLNLQCINTQTRRHNHNGASNRLSHVKVRRQGPQRGNFAVSLPRTILCRAAEEVLELSEESVAEVLLVSLCVFEKSPLALFTYVEYVTRTAR